MNTVERRESWRKFDEAVEAERGRRAFLSQKPAPNPDWMYVRVKIRRIDPRFGFSIDGRAIAFGEVVTTTEIVARDLCRRGKAERA